MTLVMLNQNITKGAGVFFSFLIYIIDIDIDIAATSDNKTPNNTFLNWSYSIVDIGEDEIMIDDWVEFGTQNEFEYSLKNEFGWSTSMSFWLLWFDGSNIGSTIINDLFIWGDNVSTELAVVEDSNRKLGLPMSTTPANVVQELIICNKPNGSCTKKCANIAIKIDDVNLIVVASLNGM